MNLTDPTFVAEAKRLTAGCAQILPLDGLAARLQQAAGEGWGLRIKFGIDPTAPHIHLGHAVVLQRLRLFQDAGHTVILIIGDHTAQVGDPTGKSKTRPMLSAQEIASHARTFTEQAFRILDQQRTEVRFNSEWLHQMGMHELMQLMSSVTVAQVLAREDFAERLDKEQAISMLEMLYPLLQGRDSVELNPDLEIGGTDQLFNLLMGRHLMQTAGQVPQLVMTMPILTGVDGQQKMSKSLGNAIGIEEDPDEQFGRTMSIPDAALDEWFVHASGLSFDQAQAVIADLASEALSANAAKRMLARLIVKRFHPPGSGAAAEARFDARFKHQQMPAREQMDQVNVAQHLNEKGLVFLPQLLVELGWTKSNSAGRRLLNEGAIKLNGSVLNAEAIEWKPDLLADSVLQMGKRRFAWLAPV